MKALTVPKQTDSLALEERAPPVRRPVSSSSIFFERQPDGVKVALDMSA